MYKFWDEPNRWLAVVIVSHPVRLGKAIDSDSTSVSMATIEQFAASCVPTSEAVNCVRTMERMDATKSPILDNDRGQRDITRRSIGRIILGRHTDCL
jgi:hypothetical protein